VGSGAAPPAPRSSARVPLPRGWLCAPPHAAAASTHRPSDRAAAAAKHASPAPVRPAPPGFSQPPLQDKSACEDDFGRRLVSRWRDARVEWCRSRAAPPGPAEAPERTRGSSVVCYPLHQYGHAGAGDNLCEMQHVRPLGAAPLPLKPPEALSNPLSCFVFFACPQPALKRGGRGARAGFDRHGAVRRRGGHEDGHGAVQRDQARRRSLHPLRGGHRRGTLHQGARRACPGGAEGALRAARAAGRPQHPFDNF
jgi:hypothetical protein